MAPHFLLDGQERMDVLEKFSSRLPFLASTAASLAAPQVVLALAASAPGRSAEVPPPTGEKELLGAIPILRLTTREMTPVYDSRHLEQDNTAVSEAGSLPSHDTRGQQDSGLSPLACDTLSTFSKKRCARAKGDVFAEMAGQKKAMYSLLNWLSLLSGRLYECRVAQEATSRPTWYGRPAQPGAKNRMGLRWNARESDTGSGGPT